VKAVKKYLAHSDWLRDSYPLFCLPNGKLLTNKQLNYYLDKLVNVHLKKGKISAHSFRAGITSIFAQHNISDTDLKLVGRWSSRAFGHYIKLGRKKREKVARKCAKVV
jgi:hypothetical protein